MLGEVGPAVETVSPQTSEDVFHARKVVAGGQDGDNLRSLVAWHIPMRKSLQAAFVSRVPRKDLRIEYGIRFLLVGGGAEPFALLPACRRLFCESKSRSVPHCHCITDGGDAPFTVIAEYRVCLADPLELLLSFRVFGQIRVVLLAQLVAHGQNPSAWLGSVPTL